MKILSFRDEMKTRAYMFENEPDNFDDNVVFVLSLCGPIYL